jgi:uncharacterized phage-associated protein
MFASSVVVTGKRILFIREGASMSRQITFRFDPHKFVNAVAYLACRCADATKMKVSKLLYFADKEHLLSYGRPISGDRYIKMEFGPVPSAGYNLIKHDERASPENQDLFDHLIEVRGSDIVAIGKPDLRYLSETDIEVLDDILSRYGSMTAANLSKLSHREPAWQNAEMNAEMDYRLMFASPDAAAIRDLVQSDQELRDALDNVQFDEFVATLQS